MAEDPIGATAPEDEEEPRSLRDRAAAGEGEPEPPEEPMEGEVQLSLNVGGAIASRNARKVEGATLRLMGGKRPIGALLSADETYQLVVRVQPHLPAPLEKRDAGTGKITAVDLDQRATVETIRRADADAVRDLFADLLGRDEEGAATLHRELGEFLAESLRAAA